jgi:hypothetical protein
MNFFKKIAWLQFSQDASAVKEFKRLEGLLEIFQRPRD